MRLAHFIFPLVSSLVVVESLGLPRYSSEHLRRRLLEYSSSKNIDSPSNQLETRGTIQDRNRREEAHEKVHKRQASPIGDFIPGRLPVTLYDDSFQVNVTTDNGGFRQTLQLVLDTQSSVNVLKALDSNTSRTAPAIARCPIGGKRGLEVTGQTRLVAYTGPWFRRFTDNSTASGTRAINGTLTYANGDIISLNATYPFASWNASIGLADDLSGFDYSCNADGILGLSRGHWGQDPSDIDTASNRTGRPVAGNMTELSLPWKIFEAPSGYRFFTTYLNWKEPERAHIGLDYSIDPKLDLVSGDIYKLDAVRYEGGWRVKPSDRYHPSWSVLIRVAENGMYTKERVTLDTSKEVTQDTNITIILDSKSEFTYLNDTIVTTIHNMIGGRCNASASNYFPVTTGSNYGVPEHDLCVIPCQRRFRETRYHQRGRSLGLGLPWLEGSWSLWMGHDTPYTYRPLWPLNSTNSCEPTEDLPCTTDCISYIQKIGGGTPRVPHASQSDWVYGHLVFSNQFFRFDLENGTVGTSEFRNNEAYILGLALDYF
ncbi:hypothetical protein ABW19_dt0202136 [Dactylella cylindrospora]|nr:hypothetical protein ABW19_dt0202136 [Dactylella cylindrospora]